MRITYHRGADAIYIHLTDDPPPGPNATTKADTPPGVTGFVALDWNNGRLVGIEILDASSRCHHDLLEQAEHIDRPANTTPTINPSRWLGSCQYRLHHDAAEPPAPHLTERSRSRATSDACPADESRCAATLPCRSTQPVPAVRSHHKVNEHTDVHRQSKTL
jgi:uncharacterized protein YuzE